MSEVQYDEEILKKLKKDIFDCCKIIDGWDERTKDIIRKIDDEREVR